MPLMQDYLRHFRFTVREFRDNARRLGFGPAGRFFLMRTLVPFGRPRRYFIGRRSAVSEIKSIDETGFVELPCVAPEIVGRLIGELLESESSSRPAALNSLAKYIELLAAAGIQRRTGLVSDGGPASAAAQLARSPVFAGLAARYLEVAEKDLIVEASVDALLPGAGVEGAYDNALRFHRDVDGYRFIKMFVYLTDCYEGDGHHEIFLGSHRHYPWQLVPIKRYTDEEIRHFIPQAVLKKVIGPAGYAFAENTLAFHRGTEPRASYRVILNLIYGLTSFKSYFHNAFPLIASTTRRSIESGD